MFDRFHAEAKNNDLDMLSIREFENLMMATGMADKFLALMVPPEEIPLPNSVTEMSAENNQATQDSPKKNDPLSYLVSLDEESVKAIVEKVKARYGDDFKSRIYGVNAVSHSEEQDFFLIDVGPKLDRSHNSLFTYNRMILLFNEVIERRSGLLPENKKCLIEHRDKLADRYRNYYNQPTEARFNGFMMALSTACGDLDANKADKGLTILIFSMLTVLAIFATILVAMCCPPVIAITAVVGVLALGSVVDLSVKYKKFDNFLNYFGTFAFTELKKAAPVTPTPQGAEVYTPPKSAA